VQTVSLVYGRPGVGVHVATAALFSSSSVHSVSRSASGQLA